MVVIKKPVNQVAEVLYELLTRKEITRMQMFQDTGILNLTARIANLRNKHGLNVVCEDQEIRNKHGRLITFGKWHLDDKENGIEVYNKINLKR